MIRCMIIDDEPLAIDVLGRYIRSTPGLELAASYVNPLEAFAYLQQNKTDLLFLDIQMPALTGMELIRSLKDPPPVIFTTAFREFGADGFEVQALDYLVKPIPYERFLKAIGKFHSYIKTEVDENPNPEKEPAFIFIKEDKVMVKLLQEDICYIEALKNYVRIKTTQREIISYYTLSYMEEKLPSWIFVRIHKSFLINQNKIEKFTADTIEIGGKLLPVGRTYQEQLGERLKKRVI